MVDQLRSLDYRARKAVFVTKSPDELLQEVLMRVEPIIY
jgi:mRNA interferase MazF